MLYKPSQPSYTRLARWLVRVKRLRLVDRILNSETFFTFQFFFPPLLIFSKGQWPLRLNFRNDSALLLLNALGRENCEKDYKCTYFISIVNVHSIHLGFIVNLHITCYSIQLEWAIGPYIIHLATIVCCSYPVALFSTSMGTTLLPSSSSSSSVTTLISNSGL